MNLEVVLQRRRGAVIARTPGELRLNGIFYGYTVEDQVREILGRPVAEWKVPGKTAIPAGRRALTLEPSPHFGPDTPTINGVEGFDSIRMHGGNTEADSLGCVILGYALELDGRIVPGMSRPMVENLKRAIREVLAGGGRAFIDIRNP